MAKLKKENLDEVEGKTDDVKDYSGEKEEKEEKEETEKADEIGEIKEEEPKSAPKSAPKVKLVDETPTKMVNIHTVENVDCVIGKVHYVIAKNKDIKVPTDVASILNKANIAYRN